MKRLADRDIELLNDELETASTEAILRWAWETFGPAVAASSSFQTQSIPLLHIISRVVPEMPIIFLNTGFHFPETLVFRDELRKTFGLNIRDAQPVMSKKELFTRMGNAPYQTDPDLCCFINKVKPMEEATKGMDALIAGVRRDQTATRSNFRVLEKRKSESLKIHPMLNWTKKDIWAYIDKYKLPQHPLLAQGYVSIGCAPCTRPVFGNQDERAGRWAGQEKNECGLHTGTSDLSEISNATKLVDFISKKDGDDAA